MGHCEGYYRVMHICGDENLLPRNYHTTYEQAKAFQERMQGKDKLDHLNCNWQIHFELREYENGRLDATTHMLVFDKEY